MKGYDEDKININVFFTKFLTKSIIIIGGLMFVNSLAQLCLQLFNFFIMNLNLIDILKENVLILPFIKTIFGITIILKSSTFVRLIEKNYK